MTSHQHLNDIFKAVGLVGGALVEAPRVEENGTISGWDVIYAPQRRFAVDMAGFAINLRLILSTKYLSPSRFIRDNLGSTLFFSASFHSGCVKFSPESCFLAQFGVPREKAEPFGYSAEPKEILVWHTKTRPSTVKGSNHGYVVEN